MTDDARKVALRAEYTARVNRVLDHIEAHITEDLTLDDLARVANFSPYHFHRIFRAMVGETLNRFVVRIRVEKAAARLAEDPAVPVTEVALDLGFSSSAAFARSFKEFFGLSATRWREKMARSKIGKDDPKIGETVRNTRKDDGSRNLHIDERTGHLFWRISSMANQDIEVKIVDRPELNVAYVRHIGPYKGNTDLFADLFGRLCRWAGPRGHLQRPDAQFLSAYHDNPEITDEDKLRVSVCLTVPEGTQTEGEVGQMTVPGGKFAVARFEIDPSDYESAWQSVMGQWLPESGFQPDDRLCFELYHGDPKSHPEGKHVFDICLPVRPM